MSLQPTTPESESLPLAVSPDAGLDIQSAIADGHFAKTLFDRRSGVIGWSHRRRFHFGLKVVEQLRPASLLDYGCGDGTFLAMAGQAGCRCVGAELSPEIVSACRSRLEPLGITFSTMESITGAFDVVSCMEVLEHVSDPADVLARLDRRLKPGGHLVVSVPIEIGLSLLAKCAARKLAGWRGMAQYSEYATYSLDELTRSVLAGTQQHIERHLNSSLYGIGAYEHKGFNWKVLRGMLAARFEIVSTYFTPLPFFGSFLNSQAWMVARKRA